MESTRILLLPLLLALLVPAARAQQTTVKFLDESLTVTEGSQFQLRVTKTGPLTKALNVIVSVEGDLGDDYVGDDQVAVFTPGGSEIATVTFTVRDDTEPEPDETTIFRLSVVGTTAYVARPSEVSVTILSNDDAFGVFGFASETSYTTEQKTYVSVQNLRVVREKSMLGVITLTFMVNGTSAETQVGQDVNPLQGTVTFQTGQTEQVLQLQIQPDDIAENDETFDVVLTGADKNIRFSRERTQLVIRANDAPVRFEKTQYRFDEGKGPTLASVKVFRGLAADGTTRIGSTAGRVRVGYIFETGTARIQLDVNALNGEITFNQGETERTITFQIIDDPDPEMEEYFLVRLNYLNGDAVWVDPKVTTVVIKANDNPNGILSFVSPDGVSAPRVQVNEDTYTVAKFPVIRNGGSFGTVSVNWQVERLNGSSEPVTNDVGPAQGTLTFQSGQAKAELTLTVVQDTNPEPSERFSVTLVAGSVSGGAKAEGFLTSELLLEDSDNVYGSVDFGPTSTQRIVTATTPRILQLQISRQGGLTSNLVANVSVSYSDSNPLLEPEDIFANPLFLATLAANVNPIMISVPLVNSAFLQMNGVFTAELISISLQSAPLAGAFNSPVLGVRRLVSLVVGANEANGEIGFYNMTGLQVQEHASQTVLVPLQVTREGLSGRAVIQWSLRGVGSSARTVTSADVTAMSGEVILESGSSTVDIVIGIKPDNIPEIDEVMTVTLDSVAPALTQKLRASTRQINITVFANDNPGGVFEFAPSMQGIYRIREGLDSVEVVVTRTGGNLLQREVQYVLETSAGVSAEREFFGSTNVLRFAPGVSTVKASILARADGTPELEKEYTLRLLSKGPEAAVLGPRTTVTIQILENDDPYGLFQFQRDPTVVYVSESAGTEVQTVRLPLQRARGTNGVVTVSWLLSINGAADLTPTAGTVTFNPRESLRNIVLHTIDDTIPEPDESFTVVVSQPTGGANLGVPTTATIVIRENDHPVVFANPLVYAREPSNVQLTVRRSGRLDRPANVRFRTQDESASYLQGDYVRVFASELAFGPGESEKNITLSILEDDLPEGNETFTVPLFDLGGDLILTPNSTATVVILANDNAYGVFAFDAPAEKQMEEGSTIFFDVVRQRGTYGEVRVFWEIRDLSDRPLPANSEFQNTSGNITFKAQEGRQPLRVVSLTDEKPESDQVYKLVLKSVTVVKGIDDPRLASLSRNNSQARITVLASDDPNGRFAFDAPDSRVAEDFAPGNQSSTLVAVTVDRRAGSLGRTQVIWEIFSDRMGPPPRMIDLMFVGSRPSTMQVDPSRRRPGTGTTVLMFSGASGNYVTVPEREYPSSTSLRSGFSISAWVQPFTTTSGYLVAKTSVDGRQHYFSVKLTTTATATTIDLTLSTTIAANTIIPSTSGSSIQDARWHHVLVSVGNTTAQFFLDGVLLNTGQTNLPLLLDGSGAFLVGARAPGEERYTGYLQDVRLIMASLDQDKVEELYLQPAKKDITPLSGVLTFGPRVKQQSYNVQSLQDIEEESNEVFTMFLISATGGAILSPTDDTATLTVLKSDNANGLFGFKEHCAPAQVTAEDSSVICVVERKRGDDDVVTVTWVIQQQTVTGFVNAVEDFVQYTGTLVYQRGERLKNLVIQFKEDTEPEQAETFQVVLMSAESADGYQGSTATSGASIDPAARTSPLTIGETDNPNGLLQFSNSSVPPDPSGPLLPPRNETPSVRVAEEAGVVALVVERAQGLLGTVSVEWRTEDVTAKSTGKTPPDFVSAAARLILRPGDRFAFLNITINDNSIPEPDKTFKVQLLNPTGGAALGQASRVDVTISASDGAFGIFQFQQLEVFVEETGDIGSNNAVIKVTRLGGLIGAAEVTWKLSEDTGNDIVEKSGVVVFRDGLSTADLVLKVRGDTRPELDKRVKVRLVSTTVGQLGDPLRLVCTVTIKANDDPYGIFVISNTQRPIAVNESNREVQLTIRRLYGNYGTVDVTYASLAASDSRPYLPSPVRRADVQDFEPVSDTVRFLPNEEYTFIKVKILDDNVPEEDESIFVYLTGVKLIQGSQTADIPGSPRLGLPAESYAQIIIRSNDDAAGVLELSPSTLTVAENDSTPVINVIRKGGTFGEVTVGFRAVDGEAKNQLDYVLLAREVVLSSGQFVKRLPIEIIDDRVPELAEAFTVELIDQIVGGAVLGQVTSARITITASDDPNGAFEFASTGMSVQEPENSLPHSINITVTRTGGALDVVTINWVALLNGEPPLGDINPTSGTLYFVSNEGSRRITVAILPDNLPEGQEDIEIVLSNATNGGRVGDRSRFVLSIAANDAPHGMVQFANASFTVQERPQGGPQYLALERIGGTYGRLRVFYTTTSVDVVAEATRGGTTALSYFTQPESGYRADDGNVLDLSGNPDPLVMHKECASLCLGLSSCLAFDFNGTHCTWYTNADPPAPLVKSPTSSYYRKNSEKVAVVHQRLATAGEDYRSVPEDSLLVPDGNSTASLPVLILDDNLPELDEVFSVRLTRVRVDDPKVQSSEPPTLGSRASTLVTIASNDNAFGEFSITSSSPPPVQGRQEVHVEEKDRQAVTFVVKREGGSIGSVSVDWAIDAVSQNATYGTDFVADGATLTFASGQTQRGLSVTILDDVAPEDREVFRVVLRNPQGGTTLGPRSSMTVVILENDNVAGIVGFDTSSMLTREGSNFTVLVRRSIPAHGKVTVDWSIKGLNGLHPQRGFRTYLGFLIFLQGQTEKTIELEVLADDTPEINEEYQLNLANIVTSGVGVTGQATLDPQLKSMRITIEGSNNPHGVLQFAESSLSVPVQEDAGTVTLQVARKFGAIGRVRVEYAIARGSRQKVGDTLILATPNEDFEAKTGVLDLGDGVAAGSITVTLVNDGIPEIDEAFLVTLSSVSLLGTADNTLPPKLASNGTVAEVVIQANDGAKGVVQFGPDSRNVRVDERNGNISLAVVRDMGTFGEVQVFYVTEVISETTVFRKDYNLNPQEITFAAGETRKYILIEILDDDDPEPDEQFKVTLTNPRSGATLGQASTAIVTIRRNDGAAGSVTFDTAANVTITEPRGDNLAGSRASIRVVRGPGIYGIVTVPFRVTTATGGTTSDISPTSGIITLRDKAGSAVVELMAVDDNLPEEEEHFVIELLAPDNSATLGAVTKRTVIIAANDSPRGLFQIFPAQSRLSQVEVEEMAGTLVFQVVRDRGSEGTVTVDVVTQAETALGRADSREVILANLQTLPATRVSNWHSYQVGDKTFVLMLTSLTTGENLKTLLPEQTKLGDGQSVVYRWQGEATYVQTLQTDGATAATSFIFENTTYVVIANQGREGGRETPTLVYSASSSGTLTRVQGLSTSGASDLTVFTIGTKRFLMVTNALDDTSNSAIASSIFVWDAGNKQFTSAPWQTINTLYARAVASIKIGSTVFLAIANYYDRNSGSYETSSIIYRNGDGDIFVEHQRIKTKGAMDVAFTSIGDLHLLVWANNRQDVVSSPQKSVLYRWDTATQQFMLLQELATTRASSVAAFTSSQDRTYLVFANSVGSSEIFAWETESGQFRSAWKGGAHLRLQPLSFPQPSGALSVMGMADSSEAKNISLFQVSSTNSQNDFVPRTVTMTFEPGETTLHTSVVILQDDKPEDTETFSVALVRPTNGAEIGKPGAVAIKILSNDNAHGVLEFHPDSRKVYATEKPDSDSTVQLNVVRQQGFFGRVVVSWATSGDHSGLEDISPLKGQLEFGNGQSVATITLTVRDDKVAELNEVTYVTLTRVVTSGSTLPDRGARLGRNTVAVVTVMANDSPHGVLSWAQSLTLVTEPEMTDVPVTLDIVRQQGHQGQIRVSYITSMAMGLPPAQRATSGEDFVTSQSSVILNDGVTEASVQIVIKQDSLPEPAETFLVNITSVELVDAAQGSGSRPSIKEPGSVTQVTIRENDDARGMVEFNVTTNIEGRLDVYETYQKNTTVRLPLARSVGLVGAITLTWQADPIEADTRDFSPPSGTVGFADGQSSAEIVLTIMDDTRAEPMETFNVELIAVSGGATLGTRKVVRVAILKNDSPAGLFRFATSEVTVRESTSVSDPRGRAELRVERVQGSDGLVNVQWRLNAEAAEDFLPPQGGTLQFVQGQKSRIITVQTKPDTILEGEERFVLSLTSADNNADISPVEGDATIIIQADPGSSGLISILPDYRLVYVGEPGESSPSYDGTAKIVLTRGAGIFGPVTVTWTITPRDPQAFLQLEGSVNFLDHQQQASIVIQAKDDSLAELRRIYTLQVNSASGGARVSNDSKDYSAQVVFVASDFPHGRFEFAPPATATVSEDATKARVVVVRRDGQNGQVRVSYVTSEGSAQEGKDYFAAAGTLVFENGVDQQALDVTLRQDDAPEGPEQFYVNLTSVTLLSPSSNNYSSVGGLLLDMKPGLGSQTVKTIVIDKNDNAEGILEIEKDNQNITVKEESLVARVLLIRRAGMYGRVGVLYQTQNLTAQPGDDYVTASGQVIFENGQTYSSINITLRDDNKVEFAKQFRVLLTRAVGGAILGERRAALVTIAKSDFPNGLFSFTGQVEITMANPAVRAHQLLAIQRTGGLLGQQTVHWRILGPNSAALVLEATNDVNVVQGGRQVTQGELTWLDGEAGSKTFRLNVEPYSTWEIQKVFVVQVWRVVASPPSAGDGEISPERGNVTLTIQKFGDPNGIVRFYSAAQQERQVGEPTGSQTATVDFPVIRRVDKGTQGAIQIFWEVTGTAGVSSDVQPLNGSLFLAHEERSGVITLTILPDDIPELTERLTVRLVRVEGGATIDTEFNTSTLLIRFNDHPHGQFGILPENQKIEVDLSDMSRRLRLNFTRHAGTFGSVFLTYTVIYNKPSAGITPAKPTGTVTFGGGQNSSTDTVDITGTGFLEQASTFTVTITGVQFLGSGGTEAPSLKAGETEVRVPVPSAAANSMVGFKHTVLAVNDDTQIVTATVRREGTYGSLVVDWVAGYAASSLPSGTVNGVMRPSLGSISLGHGESERNITVRATANPGRLEAFVLRLPRAPQTSVSGGARLWTQQTLTKVEPSGVLRFATQSQNPTAIELQGKISLTVERVYGAENKIRVDYKTREDTAKADFDFTRVEQGMLFMEPGQIQATIELQVYQDNIPEKAERFFVNLTSVERFPTELNRGISPRVHTTMSQAEVTIKESNDPYGILSLEPLSVSVQERSTSVTFHVVRSGGQYGSVSVLVRTVGSDESWTSQVVPSTNPASNDTIRNVLASRDPKHAATARVDYVILDTRVTLAPQETTKAVNLEILDDTLAEPAETVIVYLTQPQGGARIAAGAPDGGKKGFAVVTIEPSDVSNGEIGFAEDSKVVTVNEDTNPNVTLKLTRLGAFFGDVQVYWRAKKSINSSEAEDGTLGQELKTTSGVTTCPGGRSSCTLLLSLINDERPEEAGSFVVVLVRVETDARLNNASLTALVRMEASDYVHGLIGFAPESRTAIVDANQEVLQLLVKRQKGQDYDVSVAYSMEDMEIKTQVFGVDVYPALSGRDYRPESRRLTFLPKVQDNQVIDVDLTPMTASGNAYPKQFFVRLHTPLGGASLDPSSVVATVRIVRSADMVIWNTIKEQESIPMTDPNILLILGRLDTICQGELDDNRMKLTEHMLRKITAEGNRRKLPSDVAERTKSLYCLLLDPTRQDARRGRHSLAQALEEFAYTLVHGEPCPSPLPPEMVTQMCAHVKIAAAHWPVTSVQNFKYAAQRGDTFKVPGSIPGLSLDQNANKSCVVLHVIEYNSDLWFRSTAESTLLNSRVLSFGMKGRQSTRTESPATFKIHTPRTRIATRRAQCVYFDEAVRAWVGSSDTCFVTNNLDLATDDFVDCACNHLTSYAVIARTYQDGIVGYTLYFYVACFICMSCLFIVIMTHHICSLDAMFAAHLLMHMMFAAMATQICFVISAYLSPTNILVYTAISDNNSCIVMGLFMHYFFLAQFTWMMVQAINFWKILIMNDEHTDRKYFIFFLIGWALPMFLVAIFYAVTYVVYKYAFSGMPLQHIYGDVNNNGEMCFVVNPYAALGGLVIPVLLLLLVVSIVFVRAFQVSSQWRLYDDIYRGRYNITEVRALLVFWAVLVLTWLWGGLHMAYGQFWMLVVFCIFDILQGLLALVLYAVLRNSCMVCCFGQQKAGYAVSVDDAGSLAPPSHYNFNGQAVYLTPPSAKGSRASLLNESWDRDSIGPRSQMTVKRALPSQVYINPPISVIHTPSDDFADTRDFDDLIFALKAGGSFTPSENSRSMDDNLSDSSLRFEGFETQRVNIADTHL